MQQNDIKIYQDAYADEESVLCGYNGKIINKSGIIFCPYVKPSRLRDIFLQPIQVLLIVILPYFTSYVFVN